MEKRGAQRRKIRRKRTGGGEGCWKGGEKDLGGRFANPAKEEKETGTEKKKKRLEGEGSASKAQNTPVGVKTPAREKTVRPVNVPKKEWKEGLWKGYPAKGSPNSGKKSPLQTRGATKKGKDNTNGQRKEKKIKTV